MDIFLSTLEQRWRKTSRENSPTLRVARAVTTHRVAGESGVSCVAGSTTRDCLPIACLQALR
jgi:hypothetical protein